MEINTKRIKQDFLALFLIGGIFLLLQVTGIGWHCPFETVLGLPCPGCGFTRAISAAVQLDFAQAFYYHPLFWMIVPVGIYYAYTNYIVDTKPKSYDKVLYIIVAIILIVYILRWFGMIPFSYQLEWNHDALLMRLFK